MHFTIILVKANVLAKKIHNIKNIITSVDLWEKSISCTASLKLVYSKLVTERNVRIMKFPTRQAANIFSYLIEGHIKIYWFYVLTLWLFSNL